MLNALPSRSLFEFEMQMHSRTPFGPMDANIAKYGEESRVPALHQLDEEGFADFYWAWNHDGLRFAVDVPDRTSAFECAETGWWKTDGLRICINTRPTVDVRRGTRFCHFFYVLPTGGGRRKDHPVVGLHRLSRAKESPSDIDLSAITVSVRKRRRGYAIEAEFPAASLVGWNPAEHEQVGVFLKVRDMQFGMQTLSVTDELGWNADPSTWALVRLV